MDNLILLQGGSKGKNLLGPQSLHTGIFISMLQILEACSQPQLTCMAIWKVHLHDISLNPPHRSFYRYSLQGIAASRITSDH